MNTKPSPDDLAAPQTDPPPAGGDDARRVLREWASRERALLDHLPHRLYIKDRELRYIACNASFAQDRRLPVEAVIGRDDYDFYARELAERYRAGDLRVLADGGVLETEEPYSVDAETLWIHITRTAWRDESGAIIGVIGLFEDITQRKRTADELAESRRRLNTLIGNLPGIVYRCRPDRYWSMNFASEGAYQLTGYRPDAFMSGEVMFDEIVAPEDRLRVWAAIAQAIEDERSFQIAYDILHADGHRKTVWEQGTPVRVADPEGEEEIWLEGFITDISERRRLERALERKNALYAALDATNDAIIRVTDRDELFRGICHIALHQGQFRLAWIGELTAAADRLLPVAYAGPDSELLPPLLQRIGDDPAGNPGPVATAWRERRPVISNDLQRDVRTRACRDEAASIGLRACMAVPIEAPGFAGVFSVFAGETDYFDTEIAALLEKMAGDIRFTLERLRDKAEQLKAEAELRLHAQVFEESSEGMVITDADNHIVHVNRAFSEITGYSLEEARGANPRILKSGKHDAAFYAQMWHILENTGFWQGEIWNRRKDGEIYPQWATINQLRDATGRVLHHFAIFSDLTQKRAAAELDRLKRHDALTNLPNRLLLEDRASEAILHARQYHRHVALLFINLDQFHLVNDLLGYDQGDEVLRITAQRLLATVAQEATVSRLSGDTFAILKPDMNDPAPIRMLADRVLRHIAEAMLLAGRQLNLTASMGIALWPSDGDTVEELMRGADVALQSARKQGRGGYHFYTADMNREAERLFRMSAEIRAALAEDRLRLHFQPLVDINSGRVVGVEALVRIQLTDGQLLPPVEFIPVAEETGLIVPLGEWVIAAACRQLKQWRDAGLGDMLMSINISPVQLGQPNLYQVIAGALAETGIEPRCLELEFVEGALMRDVGASLELLKRLKQLGVRLAVDDFGTGHSSLSYLKQFPVDKLKIDRSFIQNITTDPNDASIVQAIIALARTLGPSTIAEGVETEAQFNYLRSLHCDQIQGYYFSPPIAPEGVPELFRRRQVVVGQGNSRAILLVDDEESVLHALKRLLRRREYRVYTASGGAEGLEILAREQVSVVLSDQRMPGMDGVEFLRRVKTMHPRVIRMILSGYSDASTITEAINRGEVYKFINKPWENEQLVAIIDQAFERYESQSGGHAEPSRNAGGLPQPVE